MNASQALSTARYIFGIACMVCAGIALMKAFGVGMPVRGDVTMWAAVAIACGLAK